MISYAVCLDNESHPLSLKIHKLYRIVSDADAEGHGVLRIIDETGEDYLYESSRFLPLELSEDACAIPERTTPKSPR